MSTRETRVSVSDWSATAGGVDYSPQSFEVTFTSGSTRECVDVEIEDDPDPEDDETIRIVIPPGPDVNPPPGPPPVVTILDNGRMAF